MNHNQTTDTTTCTTTDTERLTMPPLVSARDLSLRYGMTKVLSGATFDLAEGQVHGLVGANGTGKTTLLRALAGQLRAGGELEVFGAKPFDNPEVMDRTILMGIDAGLPGGWTLSFARRIGRARWTSWDDDTAERLADAFELPRRKTIASMSRGQKSAVALVVAFASGCPLTLLDEPYLGLDAAKRRIFYTELMAQREAGERTFVMSTHELDETERLVDTIVFLSGEGIELTGPVTDLTEHIVEVTGPAAAIEQARTFIDAPILTEERITGASRLVVDIRGASSRDAFLVDAVHTLRDQGVKVRPVTLEQAVLALSASRGKREGEVA